MTTSLKFEGPDDLSVGQIRITGRDGIVKQWVATSKERSLSKSQIEPGYYVADIEPAGVRPQSVVFEVHSGQANTVSIPAFSALVANGAGMSFLGVSDREAAVRTLFGFAADEALEAEVGPVRFVPDDALPPSVPEPVPPSTGALPEVGPSAPAPTRNLSIALAMERAGEREAWTRFEGSCSAQLSGGALTLEILPPPDWEASQARRARLTLSIEGLRIERLLLPLYRGGTNVRITTSSLSSHDVALEVTPTDPSIRSIWRALDAGTREHAEAVRDQVLRVKGPEPIAALDAADPWEAMLAGLLYLRFPEVFGTLAGRWAETLCDIHPWAADAYIIRARQLSAAAADARPEALVKLASEAAKMLILAQTRGSPYFSMANQYFNELVEGLSAFDALEPNTRKAIARARNRWQRELPLQKSAGISFSWLSRDPRQLKENNILAPKRDVSGRLPERDASVVFQGRVEGGVISLLNRRKAVWRDEQKSVYPQRENAGLNVGDSRAIPSSCPALNRPPGPPDDPNNGRFGGHPDRDGFRLRAEFVNPGSGKVGIMIIVEASDPARLNLGDEMWFCLHPTFDPQWVRLFFQSGSASLMLQAWGGFTVGAWLPGQRVELELDLAKQPDAPRLVRER